MKTKIQFAISFLFGLIFINAGLNKLLTYIPVPSDLPEQLVKANEAFAAIGWLMPLVAVAEITGGILFILPKTRALGAIVLFPVMVGILLTHIFFAPSGLIMVGILLAILIWTLWQNREKYLPMVR